MPDDNNQTKEGEDFKEGEGQASGEGQSGKDGDGDGGGDETVTISKKELDQIKSDRDNYRTATLDKKAEERELKRKETEEGGEGKDDDKGSDSGGATATIDEAKAAEIARKEISSFEERASKSNQQRASKIFLSTHKEYLEDSLWNDMMSNFHTTGNEATVEDYGDRLEAALLEHKRQTGKLQEYLDSERERGRNEGRTEAEAGSGRQAGGVGDKNEGLPEGQLSEKGKEISRGVNLDPEKVAKVDPSKDNVITEI